MLANSTRGAHELRVSPDGHTVEFWSATRLPFEPTGDLRTARVSLARAVRDLAGSHPEALLHAAYLSQDRSLVDAENVLYYNLDMGYFGRAVRQGLRFERAYNAPPPA